MDSLPGIISVLVVILFLEWLFLPFIVSGLKTKLAKLIELQIIANKNSQKLLESIYELKLTIRRLSGEQIPEYSLSLAESKLHRTIADLITEGSLSATGISLKLEIDENIVRDETLKLYQAGEISRSDCERILQRTLALKEVPVKDWTQPR